MKARFHKTFPSRAADRFLLAAAFFLLLSFCLPSLPVKAQRMSDGFDPETQLPAVYSIGSLQPSELYAKNSETALEIPAVARLMTLYLALERLSSDEQIPVSGLAARYDREERRDNRYVMRAGDSLPLRYLLLRMLYNNSDAAAIAVAEKISGSQEVFLQEMQRTAGLLGMNKTEFFACDVARAERESEIPEEISETAHVWEEQQKAASGQPLSLPEAGQTVKTARTSLRDVMRLVTTLLSNSRAKAILGVTDELVQITSGGMAQIVPIRSSASHLMTLSENRISVAYLSLSNRYSLLCCWGTTPANIPVTTVAAHLRQTGIMQPALQLYSTLDAFYDRSSLTQAGGKYPGASEKAANGELFDLVYLDSVDYIHPKTDHYLEEKLDYLGNAPYPLPIRKGAMTGQVIFTLKDGMQIPVRVGSDRDILTDSNLVSRALLLLQGNPNLAYTILGLTLILCLALLIVLVRESIRLRYWFRLQRVEQIAASARSILLGKKTGMED
ncbi:MAG TPA: hypothetical protein PK646_04395 [Bacillota bacterium]|nr:hypothetical protein [Fastidiosipila sp.]HPX92827.1 hypothetical protein [Bacillota bacterium]HQB81312.1 hypothetical protein [Bacillota bacterium]